MSFEYLPVMAQNSAPKPPRVLVQPSKPAWCALTKPLQHSRVALLTSAALRLASQPPFIPREDLSFRLVPSDPAAGAIKQQGCANELGRDRMDAAREEAAAQDRHGQSRLRLPVKPGHDVES